MSDFIETLKVNGYAKITSVFNDQEKKNFMNTQQIFLMKK